MVSAVEIGINNYFLIPFQDFSEKIISALGFLEIVKVDYDDNNISDESKELDKDIDRIKWLIRFTNDSLGINLYSIDRWVNPNGVIDNKVIFRIDKQHKLRNKYPRGRLFSKDNADDYLLQKYLMIAVNECHVIVMKYLGKYSKDFMLKGDGVKW